MSFTPRAAIGITLFMLFAVIALSDSRDLRFILLAPAAVLFTFHTALYGLEYDYFTRKSRKPPVDSQGGAPGTQLKTVAFAASTQLGELAQLI